MTSSADHSGTGGRTSAQRNAEWVLVVLLAGSALGLLLAPRDDSTLGLMRTLVFRCH